MDVTLLYYCERAALFKYYAKPDAYDEQLAVLSSNLLNYAAPLHLIGAAFMYADPGVWARWTITASEYAKTRARGINATVLDEENNTSAMDDVSDALALRHVLPVVLLLLCVVSCALFKALGPRDPLRPCRRWKFCRFRVVPERAYRTYTVRTARACLCLLCLLLHVLAFFFFFFSSSSSSSCLLARI